MKIHLTIDLDRIPGGVEALPDLRASDIGHLITVRVETGRDRRVSDNVLDRAVDDFHQSVQSHIPGGVQFVSRLGDWVDPRIRVTKVVRALLLDGWKPPSARGDE